MKAQEISKDTNTFCTINVQLLQYIFSNYICEYYWVQKYNNKVL